jgi:hypothetical protein
MCDAIHPGHRAGAFTCAMSAVPSLISRLDIASDISCAEDGAAFGSTRQDGIVRSIELW